MLDFCTGTGCIPLLFHNEFYKHAQLNHNELDIKGYDISQGALELAKENHIRQLERAGSHPSWNGKSSAQRHKSLRNIEFWHYDVLADRANLSENGNHAGDRKHSTSWATKADGLSAWNTQHVFRRCDILISNPPYVSPAEYKRHTARSVRQFEPKLALVPPHLARQGHNTEFAVKDDGDVFYPHLLDLAEKTSAEVALLEVAGLEQAKRVAAMVARRLSRDVKVEIWRDEPSRASVEENIVVHGRRVAIVGEGNGRSVVIWRRDGDFAAPSAIRS